MTETARPWYGRRDTTLSPRSLLFVLAFVLLLTAFALLIVVNITVASPRNSDLALFSVTNPFVGVNNHSPVLKFGTFGYCLSYIPRSGSRPGSSEYPSTAGCHIGGVGYDPGDLFDSDSIIKSNMRSDFAHLTPAMGLHPLLAVLSALTAALVALPCFLPAVVPVASAWLTAILAIPAVACNFILGERVRKATPFTRYFEYGSGIWCLVGAFACLVLAALTLSAAWCTRRGKAASGAARSSSPKPPVDPYPRRDSDLETAVEPREMELDSIENTRAEIARDAKAERHELSEDNKTARSELDGKQKHELVSPVGSGRTELPV